MQNLDMRQKALEGFLEMIQALPDYDGDDKNQQSSDPSQMTDHADLENPQEDMNETPQDEAREDQGGGLMDLIKRKGQF